MENLKDKRIVFIFDECHRSQFGQTHKSINTFFTCNQMIGFTGTPIFAENAVSNELGKRTTKELFDEPLHKYVITNAISDENVLKFSIEYIGRYTEKQNSAANIDIEVESIDTKELLESDERIGKIADYIIANHDRKTHSKVFTAMMCVSSVDMLIKYYETFKAKNHTLKIATIFSYSANEDDKDANGIYTLDESDGAHVDEAHINKHSREKLDEFIADYNVMFGTKYSTKDSQNFYNYYNELSKRVKNKEIDILLVVNMFLTGFDSPSLNTMYVDKNLRYHGLIQAFSRTNRTLGEEKSQGNIVCFRNLKANTDEAIALFSNPEAKEIILMKPYEEYVAKFNEAFAELQKIAPSVASVDTLVDEEEKLSFVKAFRELMRLKNILVGFSDFKWADVSMRAQAFEDYKSKYLDMYDATRTKKEKVSILEDVDFELELIVTDEINVAYILKLLAKYKNATAKEQEKQKEALIKTLSGTVQLRSKRELIEKFINDHLMQLDDSDAIESAFESFWDNEKRSAFDALCEEENLIPEELKKVIETYIYDERIPLKKDVAETLKVKPKLLERESILTRILDKIILFVERFYTL